MGRKAEIKKQYLKTASAAGFTSLSGFIQNSKFKDKEKVQEALDELKPFYLHRHLRKRFPTRRVLCHYIDHTYGMDIADVSKISKSNNGYKFIL